jgi:elongation factor P
VIRAPPGETSSVAKAWRCASFPGETCSAAGSTSTNPCASNQPRKAETIRARASRKGRRSAWRREVQKGEAAVMRKETGYPRKPLADGGKLANVRAELPRLDSASAILEVTLKVIASQIRKGNVVDVDGQLYVVLSAENFHPGKGTPTTQIDMRRISDGIKTSQRYKTTEQVERAFVEDHDYQYLYQDGDGYTFMNGETFDQVHVPAEIIGDMAPYLQENMTVKLSMHEGVPIAIELPQRVTLEVVETEPTMRGQTASSSYKPAILSNGVRTLVPGHIVPGTRIIVMTQDGSYAERAKD